jgi:hypothetical protein
MRKNQLLFIILITSFFLFSFVVIQSIRTNPQKDGYVPNKETAIKIAEAIWLPIYGENVLKEKPYRAELKEGKIWIVAGTLHEEYGGVAYAEISKKNGCILKVYHTK